MGMQITFPAL